MADSTDSPPIDPKTQKPLKACCACPETKKPRDKWFYITNNVINI